jgi:hypothetical protein
MMFMHLERSVVMDDLSACPCKHSCSTEFVLRCRLNSSTQASQQLFGSQSTYAGHSSRTFN